MSAGSSSCAGRGLVGEHLTKMFDGFSAIDDVSIRVDPGSVHALLGPNGSGKTTTVSLLSGRLQASSGKVAVDDVAVSPGSRASAAMLGVSSTSQPPKLFPELTVAEHASVLRHEKHALRSDDRRSSTVPSGGPCWLASAEALLRRLGLWDVRDALPDSVPYPQTKLTDLARALSTSPKYLLLDEPAAGAGPEEVDLLSEVLLECRKAGLGVLVVDHVLPLIEAAADRVTILESGRVVAAGGPNVLEDHDVRLLLWGSGS